MTLLTYKDYKIGQKVTCVKNDDTCDHIITVGKTYKIVDLDFHFPKKLCINGDNGHSYFLHSKYFEDIKMIRKMKLDKIEKRR